jgi:hypothetical protein
MSFAVKNLSTLTLPEWFKILGRLDLAPCMIPWDIKNRWNSTYDMLQFSIEYHVAIYELASNCKFELWKYEMSKEEWVIAAQLCKVLKVCVNVFVLFGLTHLIFS